MIIASLELPYLELVARARVAHSIDGKLNRADRDRVLDRIVDRYPEAVATVLSDMGAENFTGAAPDAGATRAAPPPQRSTWWTPALDLVDEPLEMAQ